MSRPVRRSGLRLLFLLPAGVALLAGLDAALLLIGMPTPVRADRLPEVHGVLLVLGFVGTLVSLERAVALRRPAGFLAPALLGVGALLLLSPAPLAVGRLLLVGGTAALTAVYVPLWRRQRDDAVLVQLLGAVLATGAAMLWVGGTQVDVLLPWLAGFVVLTIAGERLELARLGMGPRAGLWLVLLSCGLLTGIGAALLWPPIGAPLLGVALLALTGWLAIHDVARRTVHGTGAPRFIAACMLAGYAWLGVAGAIWMLGPVAAPTRTDAGSAYDAVVHAVFLGWTISMIIAHAPTILPAVMRRPLPYHPAMWLAAVLLHGGLVVRIWAGDGLGVPGAWQIGGLVNVVALLVFVGVSAWRVLVPVRADLAPPATGPMSSIPLPAVSR